MPWSDTNVIIYTGFAVFIREVLDVTNNKIANMASYEICVPRYSAFCIHKLAHEFSYAWLKSICFWVLFTLPVPILSTSFENGEKK